MPTAKVKNLPNILENPGKARDFQESRVREWLKRNLKGVRD